MRIYLACSLTHVPRNHFANYTAFLHRLAGTFTEDGRHKVKYALVDSDPQLATKPFGERARLCYLWDVNMVRDADVVVAECSFPSIGLGIELQVATAEETPIIILFRDFTDNHAPPVNYVNPDKTTHALQTGDGFVSLMALGLPTVFDVHRYTKEEEAIHQVRGSLATLDH